MYGWLTYNPEDGLFASIPAYGPPGFVDIDPKQMPGRKNLLQSFVKRELATDPPDVKKRISDTLEKIIGLLHKDVNEYLEFHLYMGMAHERLPEERRKARTDLIDRTIAGQFSQTTDRSGDVQSRILQLQQLALLWPDSRLSDMVRVGCAQIMSDKFVKLLSFQEAGGEQKFPRLWEASLEFLTEAAAKKIPADSPITGRFVSAVLTRLPHEVNETPPLFMQALKKLDADFLSKICEKLEPWNIPMASAICNDIFVRVLKDKLANPSSPDQDIFDTHLAWAQGLMQVQNRLTVFASAAAVNAGVPMGEKTTSSNAALMSLRQAKITARQAMTPKLAEIARKFRKSPTTTQPATEKADLDPPYSWSVPKLLRWIEGPVTRPAKEKIDREKILKLEKAASKQPSPGSAKGKNEPAPSAIALQEADIDGTIQDAFSATAAFFFGDIQDMLSLAKQLGVQNQLTEACASLLEHLDVLANKPFGPDDELKVRAILTDAEKAIADLRRGLKTAQAAAQVTTRFPFQLSAALKNEAMAWGKRHGGKIACPVHPTDWTYVDENFHDRWLPQIKNVMVGKQSTPLDEDQAAVLYVTGSSLSGYAFDVSVHIWQRYPGKTSLPSEHNDAFPAMNTDDWFDTYVPCCVLHVPAA